MHRIVLIGAGSQNFGLGVIGDIFKSKTLEGSKIVLHDINGESLKLTHKIAEDFKDKLNNKFDDKFIRMWDYYLTSCEMGFKYRDTCVFQIILSKKLHTLPYTRDYLYKELLFKNT